MMSEDRLTQTPTRPDFETEKQVRLHFDSEAEKLLTPFRKYALEKLFEFACRELGSTIETAGVEAYREYSKPEPPILWLTIFADIDECEWSRARKAISKAEAEESASWTDAEIADWSKMICFSLLPLRV